MEIQRRLADGLLKAVARAKARNPDAPDYLGRPNTVRRIRVYIRCKSRRHHGPVFGYEMGYFCEMAGLTWKIHHETLYRGVVPDRHHRRYGNDQKEDPGDATLAYAG